MRLVEHPEKLVIELLKRIIDNLRIALDDKEKLGKLFIQYASRSDLRLIRFVPNRLLAQAITKLRLGYGIVGEIVLEQIGLVTEEERVPKNALEEIEFRIKNVMKRWAKQRLYLEGFFGKTLLGDTFIEELEITLLPNIKKNNTKIDLDNIVNLIAKIDFLVFDQRQCIKASGNGIAEVKDMFGLIPKSIKLDFFLSCTDSNIKIVFTSGKDGLLEGNLLIKDFYEYELEATSNRLADRIKELSKLNFKKEPSIKFSGNLQQLF